MNNNSAPIPTDIPVNSFGEEDTIIFQIAVIVSDRPEAIMAKFTETMNSVAWNNSNPNVPNRLTISTNYYWFCTAYLIYDKWSDTCKHQETDHER